MARLAESKKYLIDTMDRKEHLHKTDTKKKPEANLLVSENTVLIKFLLAQIPHKNRDNFKTLISEKQVRVNGEIVTWYNYPLSTGQEVTVGWNKLSSEKMYPGIKIIFEDEHLIVIEKNTGVLSISTEKEKDHTAYSLLSKHVKEQNPANKIFVVHRLDRETSGIMIFAKSEEIQVLLQKDWNETILERTYIAVVEKGIDRPKGTIVSYLRESKALIVYSSKKSTEGQKAITHYKVIKSNESFSLLEVNLETGRKNQIRVHMQDIGHSVIGDKKYGSTVNPIKRIGLHAKVLSFTHPITKEPMKFETPIPSSFLRLF